MFLARYVPDPDFLGLIGLRQARQSSQLLANGLAFETGRQAIFACMDKLPRGPVLVSAQICPVVPFGLVRLGFTPRFVDIDQNFPCPGPEQLAQSSASEAVAAIISPLYGLCPSFEGFTSPLPLVLDLAQGVGNLANLTPSAYAQIYSFGIGKGVDSGGGWCISNTRLPLAAAPLGRRSLLKPWCKGALIYGAYRLGMLKRLLARIDQAVDDDKVDRPVRQAMGQKPSPGLAKFWEARLERFLMEGRLARERVGQIRGAVTSAEPNWIPLRTIVKVPADRRQALLTELKRRAIDALPAGEPLPREYLPGQPENVCFPNALHFTQEAVRLPFLGRLTDAQFDYLRWAVEDSLVSIRV